MKISESKEAVLFGFTTEYTYNDTLILINLSFYFFFQDGNTPLHIAAKLGNIETLRALLSAGANPTIINDVSTSTCNCVI